MTTLLQNFDTLVSRSTATKIGWVSAALTVTTLYLIRTGKWSREDPYYKWIASAAIIGHGIYALRRRSGPTLATLVATTVMMWGRDRSL